MLLALTFTVSCDGGDGGDVPTDKTGYVFTEDAAPTLVFAEDAPKSAKDIIYTEMKELYGEPPEYNYGDKPEAAHEIVVGNVDRPIARKAYRKLRMIQRDTDYHVAYVIYASGGSVAIAYDEEKDDRAAREVVQYFHSTYLDGKTELKLAPGVVYSGCFSVLDRLAEEDAVIREKKYAALAEHIDMLVGEEHAGLGADISDAFRSLYSIYDWEVVTWFANLYDPGVGGYYFSNSARDNDGFLPDIESTAQALGFIGSTHAGIMLDIDSTNYKNFIPEDMRREIIIYLRGLQDENGFFYHTQWAKADTDSHLSRRARDLGNAVSVLKNLGSRPRYDTPNGDKAGDGLDVIPDSIKKLLAAEDASIAFAPLGTSKATAASKVVLTAAAYDPRFESLDTLKAYLQEKIDKYNAGSTSFYAIGNEITSQMSQIKKRDQDLKTAGTEESLVKYIIEWFNSHQNPENGLWEPESKYLGVNGLLKISGVYNKAGAEIPNAEKAAQAAIDAITSDQQMSAVVDLYNTWMSVTNVLSNIKKYGSVKDGVTGAERAAEIRSNLLLVSAPAIVKSGVKMHDFEKLDGSYSYGRLYSSTTSQGMPVSIPNSVEGDVNGTVIAINGLVGNIYSALGLSSYSVPIFGSREGRIYYDILCELDPVQKLTGEDSALDFPIDFDDDAVGEKPSDVRMNQKSGSSITVEMDDAWGSQVVVINSIKNNADSITVPNNGVKTGSCYIFEADYCIDGSATEATYIAQITMGNFYMYSIKIVGDKVEIFESTTSKSSTAYYNTVANVALDKWFNVRVEYYVGDTDTVRIKFYVNDELCSVSDYYYLRTKTETDTDPAPSDSRFDSTKVYVMKTPAVVLKVDNVYSHATNDRYTPATAEEAKNLVFNVDATASDGTTDTE